jgi:hypothetical protein
VKRLIVALVVALVVGGAGSAVAQTRAELGASVAAGYTDNSEAAFVSREPPGTLLYTPLRPGGLVAATASIALLTERAAGRQVVTARLVESRFLAGEAKDTHEFEGRFDIDHASAGWNLAGHLRVHAGAFGRFEPDDVVGPVRPWSGGYGTAGGGFGVARSLVAGVRVFNELHAELVGSSAFAVLVREEVGAQFGLGRESFELRAFGTSAASSDIGFGMLASWRHALGDGWSTHASAGLTSVWREGRHEHVVPTGRARLTTRCGAGRARLEAGRLVKTDPLVGETFLVTEAVATASCRLGKLVLSAEGGVGWFDPLTERAESIVVARGVAGASWRFARLVTAGVLVQFLHQENDRLLRHRTVLLLIETGTPVPPGMARAELMPLDGGCGRACGRAWSP